MGCVCLRYVNYNLHNSRDFEWGNVLIFTFIIRFLTSKHIKYQRSMHSIVVTHVYQHYQQPSHSRQLKLPPFCLTDVVHGNVFILICDLFSCLLFFFRRKSVSCFHCFFLPTLYVNKSNMHPLIGEFRYLCKTSYDFKSFN